jgi:O-acetylhomoserine (thiol)-lyase
MSKKPHPETLALHAGWRKDEATGSVAVPIYATTAFQFRDADQAANLFALKELGNIYSRMGNPTNDALEARLAALEGGVGAITVASGMTATAYALQNLARAGDNIVASPHLYGGCVNLLKNVFRDQGIETRFVDISDPENFRKATDERTRAYYGETLPNPKLQVFPIAEVAAIGRAAGIPLIMDNTAAPLICRPFDHGAAIVTYSLTKWIGGHCNGIGGMVIDGGNFDWSANPARQPALTTADPSYHGTVWVDAAKGMNANIAYILKARTTLLRDLGACLSPFNAFLFLQGLETLPLRMRAHCENALKVAQHLSRHPQVQSVTYPALDDALNRARAEKYLHGGQGGLVGFDIKGGRAAGKAFINALKLFYHVANIGDSRSLAIHPASTTHSQLNEEEQLRSGILPGFVRLSVGIEHVDDILADLDQALTHAAKN